MKLVKSLQNKVKEQDTKINQLFQANKEFKNSVLALYMELEKGKQKDNTNNMEVAPKEKNIHLEYNDLFKFFKNAAENFSHPTTKQAVNNVFYLDSRKFEGNYTPGGVKWNHIPSSAQNVANMDKQPNNMRAIKEEMKELPTMKKRDSKVLRSPSPHYHEAWKRVSGINSRPGTPSGIMRREFTADNMSDYSHGNLYDNLVPNPGDRSHLALSREHSVVSDFDHVKDKMVDNVSINSNPGFGAFTMNNLPNLGGGLMPNYGVPSNQRFDTLSQNSKGDISDLKSISEFSERPNVNMNNKQ